MAQTNQGNQVKLAAKLKKNAKVTIYQISTALLDETICAMTNHHPCSSVESQNLLRILSK